MPPDRYRQSVRRPGKAKRLPASTRKPLERSGRRHSNPGPAPTKERHPAHQNRCALMNGTSRC